MSMSISDDVKEKSIKFNKKTLYEEYNIILKSGEQSEETTIEVNKSYDYIKILMTIFEDSETLSTDAVHNVCGILSIVYIDDDENETTVNSCFYPKYQHEVNNKNTYTIIETEGSSTIKEIRFSFFNDEDIDVYVGKFKIYYSQGISEDAIDSAVNDYSTSGNAHVILYSYTTEDDATENMYEHELADAGWLD